MPDFEELNHIKLLAELMKSMPPQKGSTVRIPFGIESKRIEWATELVRDYGVRVHPELAAKDMVSDGPMMYGNVKLAGIDTTRTVDKIDLDTALNLLRSHPDVPSLAKLADDIEDALGDPAKEQAVRDRIFRDQPDVVATLKQVIESTPPEAYEQ